MDTGNANPDDNFRYSEDLTGYIFNLKTTGLVPGTWEVTFSVAGDETRHAIRFAAR